MLNSKPARVLVAYSMESTYVPTTLEYLLALKNFTHYDVRYVHVTHDAQIDFDLNDFDVVFHNYCARLIFDGHVSAHYQNALLNFRGLKIISVQDDYDRTAKLHRAIRQLGFHVLLTCIQPEFWPLVYPKSELPGVTIVQGLTGYVPARLLEGRFPTIPFAERKIWVGYRGRDIGAKFGRLGFEKYEIGRRMREICTARGIPHDIAMDDASRIYGEAWYQFLGSSRTILGSESASNAFDFDGDLEEQIQAFKTVTGRAPTYLEFRHITDALEAPFDVGQISPRVFECAGVMTPMILFRGSYSNAIKADVHYIALEKNFSNVEVVIARLNDLEYLQGLAERCYEHLVRSGNYSYRSFACLLQDIIEEEYRARIDPNWAAFRARSSQVVALANRRSLIACEPSQWAFAEHPTDLPLGRDEFKKREAAAVAARANEAAKAREAAAERTRQLERSIRYRLVRGAWRLLPKSQRRVILEMFDPSPR